MGLAAGTVSTDALRTESVASFPIDSGSLVAASAFIDSGTAEPAQVWVSLEITISDTALAHRMVQLSQGYIGLLSSVSWHGRIPLAGGYRLTVRAYGNAVFTVRTVAIVDKSDQV